MRKTIRIVACLALLGTTAIRNPVYEVDEITLVPLESFESEKPMETICK